MTMFKKKVCLPSLPPNTPRHITHIPPPAAYCDLWKVATSASCSVAHFLRSFPVRCRHCA